MNLPSLKAAGLAASGLLLCGALLAFPALHTAAGPDLTVPARPMPELPAAQAEAWINSAPLTIAGLRGKVILVDVWATV
jgi:hypothetical protein